LAQGDAEYLPQQTFFAYSVKFNIKLVYSPTEIFILISLYYFLIRVIIRSFVYIAVYTLHSHHIPIDVHIKVLLVSTLNLC
jgi:hypothetical protein